MLACDSVLKLCCRYDGAIIALIVGQVARRESWNSVSQVWLYVLASLLWMILLEYSFFFLQTSADLSTNEARQKVTAYIMLLGVQPSFRRSGLGNECSRSIDWLIDSAE